MTQQKKEELTEDFLSYMGVELADTVIADWWLDKFEQLLQEKVEKIEKEIQTSYMKGSPASYTNKGLHTAITILKE